MRTLLLFRGAPGCGKSTFIDQNGLRPYALSADELRMMCAAPVLNVQGQPSIDLTNDKTVWQILYNMLEIRMQNGEFTVIDATNSKTEEINRYKNLAKMYRYRICLVDMTDLPVEECKRRNAQRPPHKRVPESSIDKMYARFATQKIPSGVQVLSPQTALQTIAFQQINLDSYTKIHIIGDIHGCNTCLQTYLNGPLKDDEYYIFCGDYIDRGIENAQTLQFLFSVMERQNVCLLEGNHDRWLYLWGHDTKTPSRQFEQHTKYQLFQAGIDKKKARILYRHTRQCAWFWYDNNRYLVTHGGLSTLPKHLLYVSTKQMIHGVGRYEEASLAAQSWESSTFPWDYQIFGHRNVSDLPIDIGHRCYNLEGGVEFGGHLRCLELEHGKPARCVETSNTVFANPQQHLQPPSQEQAEQLTVSELVSQMRASPYVHEKTYGAVSAFNFTRDAFYGKHWDAVSTKARGLFINTETNQILARSYDKFFQINERSETKLEKLRLTLQFPLYAYRKENGFLGLVAYNPAADDLFISSKTSPEGEHSAWFRQIFLAATTEPQRQAIRQFLQQNNCTMVCEVIDPIRDPHIIEYEHPHFVVLDFVKNLTTYQKLPFKELLDACKALCLPLKKQMAVLATWPEFYQWYEQVMEPDYTDQGKPIEGFVLEDSKGFQFKLKLPYYKQWKFLRGIAQSVKRQGRVKSTAAFTSPLQNYFYGYLRELYEADPQKFKESKATIIDLRKDFLQVAVQRGYIL